GARRPPGGGPSSRALHGAVRLRRLRRPRRPAPPRPLRHGAVSRVWWAAHLVRLRAEGLLPPAASRGRALPERGHRRRRGGRPMSRPRDSQRPRCYEAERVAAARRPGRLVPRQRDAQGYVDDVTGSAWWKEHVAYVGPVLVRKT